MVRAARMRFSGTGPSAPCGIVSFCGLGRALLVLAEDHGVTGHLAASLRGLEEDLVPPEIRQALADRQRAQESVYFAADRGSCFAYSTVSPRRGIGGPRRERASTGDAGLMATRPIAQLWRPGLARFVRETFAAPRN